MTPDMQTFRSYTLSQLTEATFPGGDDEARASWRNRLRVLGVRGGLIAVSGGGKSGKHRRYDDLSVLIARTLCTLLDVYRIHSDVAIAIGHYIRASRERLDCPDPVLVLGEWPDETGQRGLHYFIDCREVILDDLRYTSFSHLLILPLYDQANSQRAGQPTSQALAPAASQTPLFHPSPLYTGLIGLSPPTTVTSPTKLTPDGPDPDNPHSDRPGSDNLGSDISNTDTSNIEHAHAPINTPKGSYDI